ncbi:DUF3085 domain-containing protein (plasmid) [Agrobacterium leguminum]|uniref:DUF3085 domain-containing protein n=1 Tax=Agrobacterium leguminum TaxID=2792015 RepID=UPI0010C9E154|nr:DUF3085 domain-containing protein [Agrobacterium leguminum]WFS69531.1 DUF3085 domain-containing protein [Agrobacterium leguminum]
MRLTFPHPQLRKLLAEAEIRWSQGLRLRWGIKDPAGFWLIGDQGVYLMHNGRFVEGEQRVVYAIECDPTIMPFEQWSSAKRISFGCVRGCEFIDEEIVRDAVDVGSSLIVEFASTTMTVGLQTHPAIFDSK